MMHKLSKRVRKQIMYKWFQLIVVRQMRVMGTWAMRFEFTRSDDGEFSVMCLEGSKATPPTLTH